jgi:hypothetical protein
MSYMETLLSCISFKFEAVLNFNDLLRLDFLNSGPMIELLLSSGALMLISTSISVIMRMI